MLKPQQQLAAHPWIGVLKEPVRCAKAFSAWRRKDPERLDPELGPRVARGFERQRAPGFAPGSGEPEGAGAQNVIAFASQRFQNLPRLIALVFIQSLKGQEPGRLVGRTKRRDRGGRARQIRLLDLVAAPSRRYAVDAAAREIPQVVPADTRIVPVGDKKRAVGRRGDIDRAEPFVAGTGEDGLGFPPRRRRRWDLTG